KGPHRLRLDAARQSASSRSDASEARRRSYQSGERSRLRLLGGEGFRQAEGTASDQPSRGAAHPERRRAPRWKAGPVGDGRLGTVDRLLADWWEGDAERGDSDWLESHRTGQRTQYRGGGRQVGR